MQTDVAKDRNWWNRWTMWSMHVYVPKMYEKEKRLYSLLNFSDELKKKRERQRKQHIWIYIHLH